MRLGLGVPMIMLLLLTACGFTGGNEAEQMAQDIRDSYLEMTNCTSTIDVVADYGQRVYNYTMDMTWAQEGEMVLTITAPESIAGITVRGVDGESFLTYDDIQVETGPLYQGGMSPVDAVPTFLYQAREGFIARCSIELIDEVEVLRISCQDPEGVAGVGEETTLWFDTTTGALLRGELAMDGATVIQCTFRGFTTG